jgi:general secretion pathway protein H
LRSDSGRTGGFTLLEMLVVIIVLALMIGIVLAAKPAESPAASLESAVDRVAGTLRLARGEAIASDRQVLVKFDPVAQTVQVGTGPAARLAAGATMAAGPAYQPLRVIFAPDGTASGGPIVLAAGDLRREIDINWMTGEVTEGRVEEGGAETGY